MISPLCNWCITMHFILTVRLHFMRLLQYLIDFQFLNFFSFAAWLYSVSIWKKISRKKNNFYEIHFCLWINVGLSIIIILYYSQVRRLWGAKLRSPFGYHNFWRRKSMHPTHFKNQLNWLLLSIIIRGKSF